MIFIARSQSATAPAKSINLRVVRSRINILLHKDRKSKSAMTITIEDLRKTQVKYRKNKSAIVSITSHDTSRQALEYGCSSLCDEPLALIFDTK